MKSTFAAVLFAAVSLVSAHGTPSGITIGGVTYPGPDAAEGKPFWNESTPIRQLALLEPIGDMSSPDTVCGRGAADSAELVAPVKAGTSFSFTMRGGNGAKWPHGKGPVMAYLARCPGSARTCDPTNLKWFKADQLGLKPSGQNAWFQEDLAAGQSVTLRIPKAVQDGDYLLRLEILAIHNAMSVGGAETTVSCTQIRISGGGGVAPKNSQLIKFPAYQKTDPGILVNIWDNFKTYSFPGPAVFPGGSSGGSPKPTDGNGAPVNVAPTPTEVPTPTNTKVCRRSRNRRATVVYGSTLKRRGLHHNPARYASIH